MFSYNVFIDGLFLYDSTFRCFCITLCSMFSYNVSIDGLFLYDSTFRCFCITLCSMFSYNVFIDGLFLFRLLTFRHQEAETTYH